jgi:hypothetical protein
MSTFTDTAGHVSTTTASSDYSSTSPAQTDLPGTPSTRSLSPHYVHRARNAPRPSCSSLVASRQAPNLPRTTTNENPRTLPFQTRFRAPSGLSQQYGGEGHQFTNCQILSTTTGGHRTLLAGTRSCWGATLYRHLPTSAAITTVEVTRKDPLAVTGLVYRLTPEIAAPLRQRPAAPVSLQSRS